MPLSAIQGHTRFQVKVTAKTEPFNLVGGYRHWQEPTAREALVIADRNWRCCECIELEDVCIRAFVLHGWLVGWLRKQGDGDDFVLGTNDKLIRKLYCMEVRLRVCCELRLTSNSRPIFGFMYCSFVLWLHCIVDFPVLILVSICVCFWRTHFVYLIRSESVPVREVNGDAGVRPSANPGAEIFARVIQASVDEAVYGVQPYRHNRASCRKWPGWSS
jgi:hypothetical protein